MAVNDTARDAYQERITNAAVDTLRDRKDALIIAPTGAGKTRMALSTHRRLQMDGAPSNMRALFVVDRVNLAEQNLAAAVRAGISGGVLWTDGKHRGSGSIAFASIDTALRPGADLRRINFLVVDEVHHAAGAPDDRSSEYQRLVDRVTKENPDVVLLGMSATENRKDRLPLHPRIAAATRLRVTHHEAMSAGAIVPVTTIVPEWRLDGPGNPTVAAAIAPMFAGTDRLRRDESITTLLQSRRPRDFLDYAVEQTLRHAPGVPTFAYTSRLTDADALADAYRSAGLRAEAIHYRQPANRNRATLEAFNQGHLDVLTSVGMLREGIDVTRTGAVVNISEISSFSNMMQATGRALRAHTERDATGRVTYDKPRAIHLDLGATTFAHGTPEVAMALETLGYHGHPATPTRLWKTVAGDPPILAMERSGTTLFAVGDPLNPNPERRWALYLKDRVARRGRADDTQVLKRAPTPWASDAGLEEYERDQARARPRLYAVAESQSRDGRFGANPSRPYAPIAPDSTALQRSSDESYKDSAGALRAITALPMTHPTDVSRRAPPPKRASNSGFGY